MPDSTRLLHGPNLLPDEPAEFKPMIRSWTEKCKVLGMALMEATAMGLGLNLESDEWNDLKSKVVDSFWYVQPLEIAMNIAEEARQGDPMHRLSPALADV